MSCDFATEDGPRHEGNPTFRINSATVLAICLSYQHKHGFGIRYDSDRKSLMFFFFQVNLLENVFGIVGNARTSVRQKLISRPANKTYAAIYRIASG